MNIPHNSHHKQVYTCKHCDYNTLILSNYDIHVRMCIPHLRAEITRLQNIPQQTPHPQEDINTVLLSTIAACLTHIEKQKGIIQSMQHDWANTITYTRQRNKKQGLLLLRDIHPTTTFDQWYKQINTIPDYIPIEHIIQYGMPTYVQSCIKSYILKFTLAPIANSTETSDETICVTTTQIPIYMFRNQPHAMYIYNPLPSPPGSSSGNSPDTTIDISQRHLHKWSQVNTNELLSMFMFIDSRIAEKCMTYIQTQMVSSTPPDNHKLTIILKALNADNPHKYIEKYKKWFIDTMHHIHYSDSSDSPSPTSFTAASTI